MLEASTSHATYAARDVVPWEAMSDTERELYGDEGENTQVIARARDLGFGVVMMVYGEPRDTDYRDMFMLQAIRVLRRIKTYYPDTPAEIFVSPHMLEQRTAQVARACVGQGVHVRALDVELHPEISGHMYKVVALRQSNFALPLFLDTDLLPCPHSLRVLLQAQLDHSYDLIAYKESGKGAFHATAGKRDWPKVDMEPDDWARFQETPEMNSGVALYNMSSQHTQHLLERWVHEHAMWSSVYFPHAVAEGAKIRADTDQGPLRIAVALVGPSLRIGLSRDTGVQLQETEFHGADKRGCDAGTLFRHGSSYKVGDRQHKFHPPRYPAVELRAREEMCDRSMQQKVLEWEAAVGARGAEEAQEALLLSSPEHNLALPLPHEWWDGSQVSLCSMPESFHQGKTILVDLSFPFHRWHTKADSDAALIHLLASRGWHAVVGLSHRARSAETLRDLPRLQRRLCTRMKMEMGVETDRMLFSHFPWSAIPHHFHRLEPSTKFIFFDVSEEDLWRSITWFRSSRRSFYWDTVVLGECTDPLAHSYCKEVLLDLYRTHKQAVRALLSGSPNYMEVRVSGDLDSTAQESREAVSEALDWLIPGWDVGEVVPSELSEEEDGVEEDSFYDSD
eukprot:TRINITY_DN4050_c0_g1_i1.p1 TRINITY_DN4050_c0_g1~~TRINITY_DN4050_c0_g1_i1.p1  ORF type:complete len:693 (-),score=196.59 TRINITY_DN4050_c0_g1_i1:276-2138(-)